MSRLTLDYTNMLSSAVGARGIEPAALDAAAELFTRAHEDTEQRRTSKELGFFELPYQSEIVDEIARFADTVGQAFGTVVVLGIGGSALGTLALQSALVKPHWNELDEEQREYFPRLYVLDNVDPTTIGPLLDRIDLRKTLFNVVSKSGATAETMAQFLIVRDRLERAVGKDAVASHFVFTTDPAKGVLREIAHTEQIASLPVPSNVGGRFSVFSAVGLLPAALIGIDIRQLLAGAAEMDERCRTSELRANPAGLFAVLQHLAHTQHGAPLHVMLPYTDRLYLVADWFRQLWAESLGKRVNREGKEVFTGPTPIKALGATDQHSQVQLYMEGPFDKTVALLSTHRFASDVAIPALYTDNPALAYLGGKTLGELLEAERIATESALTRAGRMNMSIQIPAADAHSLGQLLMMLQIATVYAGFLYGVNPLDQPGVELGKELTYALMGRPGYPPPEPAAGARHMAS